MGISITFKTPQGSTGSGYFVSAGKAGAPGIVVIQEWWGVQDQIKAMVERFAALGFDALAPDLYPGAKTVPYHDRAAAAQEMKSLDYVKTTEAVVAGAVDYLAANGAKVGIMGCCLGGAIAIIAATKLPRLSAIACAYGLPPGGMISYADVKIPLQGHFAVRDDWCTPALVTELEQSLTNCPDAKIHRYDADHGFLNEQRLDVHHRQQAEIAWGRMDEFFGHALGRGA